MELRAKEPGSRVLSGTAKGTLQACKQSRAWQQAVQVIQQMRREKLVPDLFAWTSVIACCSTGQWQLALSWLDEMVEVSVQPNVVCYNGVLSALSRGTQAETALSAWRSWEAQGVHPTTVTFTALMSGSSWGNALELLQSMFQRRVQVDLVAWNTALNACADGRSWSHALDLLQRMEDDQVSPDIISFSSCVAACATTAWPESIQLFSLAGRQFRLDAQICVAVLTACATGSCWQQALQVLQSQPALLRSRHGLGALIPALVASWPRALQLLQDNRGSYADLVTWNTLLAATPWEQGVALLSQLPSQRLAGDCASYGAVLRSCEHVHEWEAALALLHDMAQSQLPDLPAWCSTLSACEKGRQWQRCLLILAEMWTTVPPDIVAYGAAVSACERCGQWPSALQLLEDLRSHQLRLDQVAGNALLSALGSGQQWPLALMLFDDMAQAEMVDLISYNALMDQCPWHQAMALSEEMRRSLVQPDLITFAALSQRLDAASAAVAAQRRCCAALELQGLALLQRRALWDEGYRSS